MWHARCGGVARLPRPESIVLLCAPLSLALTRRAAPHAGAALLMPLPLSPAPPLQVAPESADAISVALASPAKGVAAEVSERVALGCAALGCTAGDLGLVVGTQPAGLLPATAALDLLALKALSLVVSTWCSMQANRVLTCCCGPAGRRRLQAGPHCVRHHRR